MHKLLVSTILPHARRPRTDASHAPASQLAYPDSDVGSKNAAPASISEDDRRRRATLLVALHLLNPIVIGISTRGSSESVLTLLVLFTLFCALRGWWDWTAAMLGLSTHWKIYPVIYGVSCVGVIGMEHQQDGEKSQPRGVFPRIVRCIDVFVNAKTVRFATISAGTFLVLGTFVYSM
jgi:phosphatidylinositol glycan class M